MKLISIISKISPGLEYLKITKNRQITRTYSMDIYHNNLVSLQSRWDAFLA